MIPGRGGMELLPELGITAPDSHDIGKSGSIMQSSKSVVNYIWASHIQIANELPVPIFS